MNENNQPNRSFVDEKSKHKLANKSYGTSDEDSSAGETPYKKGKIADVLMFRNLFWKHLEKRNLSATRVQAT